MEKPNIEIKGDQDSNIESNLEKQEELLNQEIERFKPNFSEVLTLMESMDLGDTSRYSEAMRVLDRGFQDARARIAGMTGFTMGTLFLYGTQNLDSISGDRAIYGAGALSALMVLGLGLSKIEEWITEFKASRQSSRQFKSKFNN